MANRRSSLIQTPRECFMRTAIGFCVLLIFCAGAVAGPEQIIKERAKELRNQNNVRQGVGAPTPAGTQTTSGAVTATPVPNQQNMTAVQNDLAAIQTGTQISLAQKQKLARELIAAAQTGGKPSEATALKLAGDLLAACAEKALPAASRTRLIAEMDSILNPGKYPQAKLDAIFADVQAIFQANGLKRADATTIADDLKIVSAEVQRK